MTRLPGMPMRGSTVFAMLVLACTTLTSARAQEGDPAGAIALVAAPRLIDPDYRETVLLVVPIENSRHVGVIVNKPTRNSLARLFPEHAPSKLVHDPVYFGGPMQRQAIFAVVHIDHTPGPGSIQMMKELFLALQAKVVDQIIEATPNEARYYMGYVVWLPGELRQEVDRGYWYVLDADPELVFRKNPAGLWEELLRRARAVTAGAATSSPVPAGALSALGLE